MTENINTSLDILNLSRYAVRQLNTFFPDGTDTEVWEIFPHVASTIEKIAYCFSHITIKYYKDNTGNILFNHLHGDHYAMFLYRLSNILYNETSDRTIPTKLFLLNKLLHGIDIFYEINLPDIFILNHPVGTVLGRGNYADYLIVCQRCTVGNNRGIYPTFGKFTTLYPGATVLGNCNIGENCAIASESFLLDTNLKSDSLYIGNPQSYVIKNNPAQTRWKTA